MTDEELVQDFYRMFPNAPNPEHYPKSFNYYVRMYKFLKLKGKEKTDG